VDEYDVLHAVLRLAELKIVDVEQPAEADRNGYEPGRPPQPELER
jgi:hypothetical protein